MDTVGVADADLLARLDPAGVKYSGRKTLLGVDDRSHDGGERRFVVQGGQAGLPAAIRWRPTGDQVLEILGPDVRMEREASILEVDTGAAPESPPDFRMVSAPGLDKEVLA